MEENRVGLLENPENAPWIEIGPIDEFPNEFKRIENVPPRMYFSWAAIKKWGSWMQIYYPIGTTTCRIEYTTVSSTTVYGAVSYYSVGGWVTQQFKDSITFTTGKKWGAIAVCFYGDPYGAVVEFTLTTQ